MPPMSETKGKPRENARTAPGESKSATKESQDFCAREGWRQRKKKQASKRTMLWFLLSLFHSKATPEHWCSEGNLRGGKRQVPRRSVVGVGDRQMCFGLRREGSTVSIMGVDKPGYAPRLMKAWQMNVEAAARDGEATC